MSRPVNYAKMFVLRSDGRYQGKYKDSAGKWHTMCDRDPKRLYERLEEKMHPTKRDFLTISEEWDSAHALEVEVRTRRNYLPHLKQIQEEFGGFQIADITAQDVQTDLQRAKAEGYSRTIVNMRRSLWRSICDYAILQGDLKISPVSSVSLPKGLKAGRRKAPTMEEITTILQSVDAPFGFFPFFLVCTGCRKSEALALTWADIDFQKSVIHITKGLDWAHDADPVPKSPKSEAGIRDVTIIPILLPHLMERAKNVRSAYVFPAQSSNAHGKGGGIMTQTGFDCAWDNYCRAVGFWDDQTGKHTLTAHQLRHAAATLRYFAGSDEKSTQAMLGHADSRITHEIYTDLDDAQKKVSDAKFGDLVADLVSKSR